MGAFFMACPHYSRVEYVTFEGYITRSVTPSRPEFDVAIESTVAHLPSLRMVEIKSTMTPSHATFPEWKTTVEATLPSLLHRGMLRVTKYRGMNGNFSVGFFHKLYLQCKVHATVAGNDEYPLWYIGRVLCDVG